MWARALYDYNVFIITGVGGLTLAPPDDYNVFIITGVGGLTLAPPDDYNVFIITGVGGLTLAPPDGMWARALYDYDATSSEELSFIEGELIKILRKVNIFLESILVAFVTFIPGPYFPLLHILHLHILIS